ncbi:unnamed protein product [Nyctereutes procyonoides]|uniref:(raccoon dog) hypothetical protein n=1 Tax=Nyctereutes procyonoides TaxID=34880 RepID=A0A811Z0N7_NYCPR|nr:unnamed protein product [Nyctereutes procyonoides]
MHLAGVGIQVSGLLEAEEEDEFYQMSHGGITKELRNKRGDSDFDIHKRNEPSSDREVEERRRKCPVILRPQKVSTPASNSQKGPHCEWPLTHEELLREARITEELNLHSLEIYEQLQVNKKQQVHKKQMCPGPIITYHSVAVLPVEEPGPKEENMNVEGLLAPTASALTPHASTGPINPPPHCSYTFTIFSDDVTIKGRKTSPTPLLKPSRSPMRPTSRTPLPMDCHTLASALPKPLPGSGPQSLHQKIAIK